MQDNTGPWWASLTVWVVVNTVNVLQSIGFLSRITTGSSAINQRLGYMIIILAIPTIVALTAFVRAGATWLLWMGPLIFLAFIVLMMIVDYAWPVEFRSPIRYDILIPYLVLFFGSIVVMGVPMYRLNVQLWLVTVTTTLLLLGSMGAAMYRGVG